MKKQNVGIITYPICALHPNTIPLSDLINILKSISDQLFIILGTADYSYQKQNEKLNLFCIKNYIVKNNSFRFLKEVLIQLKISLKIFKIGGRVELWVFFIGGDVLFIPMLTAKLLRKKIILFLAGSAIKTHTAFNDPLVFGLKIQNKLNCILSDNIILYSKNLINDYNLEKWEDKIIIAHRHYIDFDKFKIKKGLNYRENLVGYIGRLSEEKGVFNLLNAIPQIVKVKNDIKFIFIGDGKSRDKIEQYLTNQKLHEKVKIVGWISHDDLPNYLNELKLVVLPSYTEGLPNVILEAMACGTPVLATSIGAIPDIIEDNETGFLMENNSPECIVANIQRALNHQNLMLIVNNAKKLVKKDFTFEIAVKRYTEILKEI